MKYPSGGLAVALLTTSGLVGGQLVQVTQFPAGDGTAHNVTPEVREAQGMWHDGSLYVFGGFVPDCRFEPEMPCEDFAAMDKWTWKWTPIEAGGTDGEWEELSAMPIDAVDLGGNTHCGNTIDSENNKMYITGGLAMPLDETDATRTVWGFENAYSATIVLEYDVPTDTWVQLPDLPGPVGAGGAAYVNGTLHVISGALSDPTLDVFDTTTEPIKTDVRNHFAIEWSPEYKATNWSWLPPPLYTRNHLAVTALGGKIYAVGGQLLTYEACTNMAVVEVYDPAIGEWSLSEFPMPEGRGHISASALAIDDSFLLLVGGVKDKPNQCRPAGTHVEQSMILDPTRGWSLIDEELPEGPTMVCGVEGTGDERDLYCNTPDGIVHSKFILYPEGSVDAVALQKYPGEDEAVAALEVALATQYAENFAGKGGEMVDIGGFCDALATARGSLPLTLIFDAIYSYSARDNATDVDFAEDYAFGWWSAFWFGWCSANLDNDDISTPSLLSARRDYDALTSTAETDYDASVAAMNELRWGSSELCAFSLRELYAQFVHGFVAQRLANDMSDDDGDLTLAEGGDFLCQSSPSLEDLAQDCEQGVGYAAFLLAAEITGFYTFAAGQTTTPVQGGFYNNVTDDVKAQILDLANDIVSGGDVYRTMGVQHAYDQLVVYAPGRPWMADQMWMDAFVPGLTVPWPEDAEPVLSPCSDAAADT
ncbi:hypothetical protein CTAYLR_008847 [Chrysophaeum taylorii]|uniref:Uncharacterized protein n=1 Tax=Chrysophaeum taylorii TaxID=2483200 RepID=A0AAD7UNI3_9STRA|nr:hypothetical protein CTAYLR_008847 [Chrysophaeum taylorii]